MGPTSFQSSGRRSARGFAARALVVAQLGAVGALALGTSTASAAAPYPGELLVADASAFQGTCSQGCGGLIAVDPATGAESALSDNLMAINAQTQFMDAPFTLALDPNGDIIVGETAGLGGSCPSSLLCGGLVEVSPSTGKQTLLSSNTMPINATSQYFGQVNGVAINNAGQIFVSDWGGCDGCGKVIEVNPADGKETLISSNTMPINANSQFLQYPQGLTLAQNGDIYVADALAFGGIGKGGGIVEVDRATGKQTEVSANSLPVNANSQYFTGVGDLVFDSAGDILAADWGGGHIAGKIIQVDPSTGKESIFSSNAMSVNAGSALFDQPVGITIDRNGEIYVADEGAFCTSGCGGLIEVNPVTRAETEISSNLMAVNGSSRLFAEPWAVVAFPSGPGPGPGQPADTVLPAIAGTDRQGQKLTASTGTWNPAATSYGYAWQRLARGDVGWTTIVGADSASYVPARADLSGSLRVVVTATDDSGHGTAVSAPVGPVSSGAPANVSPPTVTRNARLGRTLIARAGTWSPSATSYGYRWQRSTGRRSGWSNIRGATKRMYTTVRVDKHTRFRVRVNAENAYGDATAVSRPTEALKSSPRRRPARSGGTSR